MAVTAQPDPETTISEDAPVAEKPVSLTLLESLLSLIKNEGGKCPDEVRTNVCVLLRNALDSASRDGEGKIIFFPVSLNMSKRREKEEGEG